MTKVTDCPFPIVAREGFRGIFGGSDPIEEAANGYYEGDGVWMNENREACIWFLRQLIEDPCEEKSDCVR